YGLFRVLHSSRRLRSNANTYILHAARASLVRAKAPSLAKSKSSPMLLFRSRLTFIRLGRCSVPDKKLPTVYLHLSRAVGRDNFLNQTFPGADTALFIKPAQMRVDRAFTYAQCRRNFLLPFSCQEIAHNRTFALTQILQLLGDRGQDVSDAF